MNEYLIPCKIERGGFRSERTFEIQLPEQGEVFIGTAYFDHFLSQSKDPLRDDEPPEGKSITGFVKCRLIRNLDSIRLMVEVPSGDVLTLSAETIEKRNCGSRELASL